jgi:hypothetical protein
LSALSAGAPIAKANGGIMGVRIGIFLACAFAATAGVAAAQTPSVAPGTVGIEAFCDRPGMQYVPQCQPRGPNGDNNRNRPTDEGPALGWAPPVERLQMSGNQTVPIVRLPAQLVRPEFPPLWVRMCRANTAGFDSGVSVFVDAVPQRAAFLTSQGCIYVGFTHSLQVQTSAFDTALLEYQWLGRF